MEFRRFDSSEGNVFKYVFSGNDFVAESVLYRYSSFAERTVICCSTQSGCPVGCSFCGTGKRFVRNLTSDEIVAQIEAVIKDQTMKDAGYKDLDFIRSVEQSFINKGYNTRVFDPAGQDDIGGGCGQLWFVQRWLAEHKSAVANK